MAMSETQEGKEKYIRPFEALPFGTALLLPYTIGQSIDLFFTEVLDSHQY